MLLLKDEEGFLIQNVESFHFYHSLRFLCEKCVLSQCLAAMSRYRSDIVTLCVSEFVRLSSPSSIVLPLTFFCFLSNKTMKFWHHTKCMLTRTRLIINIPFYPHSCASIFPEHLKCSLYINTIVLSLLAYTTTYLLTHSPTYLTILHQFLNSCTVNL